VSRSVFRIESGRHTERVDHAPAVGPHAEGADDLHPAYDAAVHPWLGSACFLLHVCRNSRGFITKAL